MKYPIIQVFNNDKNIYAQIKSPALASVDLLSTFANSVILDSDGNMYKVKKAYKTAWAYLLGYHPLMKGRTAKIAYEFSEIRKLSLDEFKQFVIDKLNLGVKNDFWYKEKDIPTLVGQIKEKESFESVIECFI